LVYSYKMENELRPFWRNFFGFNWKFGLFLILIICLPRFLLVLNANETANYGPIGLIMVISAIAPFIFLSRKGRGAIGLRRPSGKMWLIIAFVLGLMLSLLLCMLGVLLYDHTIENWYVYIGRSYSIPAGIKGQEKLILFMVMSVTGMIFSPIGEELFFRGIVHSSFAKSFGNLKASVVDSLAFAITHISHFGIVFLNGQWEFLSFPTLIWVLSMFVVSILFYLCRQKTDSLMGAILCHSSFNLGMIYCIFYQLN